LFIVGSGSVSASDNFDGDVVDHQLSELQAYLAKQSQPEQLIYQNDSETFEKVKTIQLKRAADKKTQSVVPLL